MIANHITDLIGNTPLLKIPERVHSLPNINLYAKLEMMNPLGSVKDRTAWAMLKDDIESIVEKEQLIVENSSGNTAKALQGLAASFGVPFKLMTTMAKIPEVLETLRVMGADVEELPYAGSDCFDPNDPHDPQYEIERFVKSSAGKAYFPSQFTNLKNVAAHAEATGPEILQDLPEIDWLVGGLGTGGSTRGIAETIRKHRPDLKCIGVCAAEHEYIPGIRNMAELWNIGLFERTAYTSILSTSATEAVDAMLMLNHSCGLLCGPSAGAQFAALKSHFTENPADTPTNVVFIACDRMESYLSYIRQHRPHYLEEGSKPSAYAAFAFQPNENYSIAAAKVDDWMSENTPLVVDTRSPVAFKLSHLPGALNIPEPMLGTLLDSTTPFPADRPILMVCAVGFKSAKAAAYLRQKGCDAYALEEGYAAYKDLKQTA